MGTLLKKLRGSSVYEYDIVTMHHFIVIPCRCVIGSLLNELTVG